MPIGALHHFGLTVTDLDASARWYGQVLGFERVAAFESPDGQRRKVFLRHPGLNVRLGLTEHRNSSKDPFDETRTGLDHLGFAVGSAAELQTYQEHLARLKVVHSPITPANSMEGAQVLVFRDPDNIQLELVFDPGLPGST